MTIVTLTIVTTLICQRRNEKVGTNLANLLRISSRYVTTIPSHSTTFNFQLKTVWQRFHISEHGSLGTFYTTIENEPGGATSCFVVYRLSAVTEAFATPVDGVVSSHIRIDTAAGNGIAVATDQNLILLYKFYHTYCGFYECFLFHI